MPKHYDEALVGEAIERVLDSGALDRDSLFVQTKFTPDACDDQPEDVHPYDPGATVRQQVFQSFNSSLQHLRINRIDSVLLHSPYKEHSKSLEAFEALVTLRTEGRVRFVGVSNFGLYGLKRLVAEASEPPDYVQNRCQHKNDWDGEVRRFCAERGIVYQGFWLLTGNRHITSHASTQAIAERKGVSVQAVLLAFLKNHLGIIVLDGTKQVEHMKQDLAAGAIELSADDIRSLEAIELPGDKSLGIQANFVNTLDQDLSVYWKNTQTGELVVQGTVQPQGSLQISTFDSHVFVARESTTERGTSIAIESLQYLHHIIPYSLDVTQWKAELRSGKPPIRASRSLYNNQL